MDGERKTKRAKVEPTPLIGALMIGAGEYTSGAVFTAAGAAPDKPCGVVAVTFTDMRRRGKIGKMVLADAVGTRLPAVRKLMGEKIGAYKDMDLTMETFPADDVAFDPGAYKLAIAKMSKGDIVTIFTPDNTHFQIALDCLAAGLHVMIAKPAVKKLEQHRQLVAAAAKAGTLCCIEYHKRFDPIYTDARDRAQSLGPFSFFNATMTQAKAQLDTFKAWAGKASDISFYLNSHHMDWHCWAVSGAAKPTRVVASAAHGAAVKRLKPADGRLIEDTITLMADWEGIGDNSADDKGMAVYTASWAAPKADCHTQQYFHYMGQEGEIRADQAHRGYAMSTDQAGFAALNPLYMKYTKGPTGHFAGQQGYGYRSLEEFVHAAQECNAGTATPADISARGVLATIDTTLHVTAMLEAGRMSLDKQGNPVNIVYGDPQNPAAPTALVYA